MKKYKIFFTDLDGTLLDPSGELREDNMEALRRIAKTGCIVVPASGRCLAELPRDIVECKELGYLILSDGAKLYDRATGEQICASIPHGAAREIFNIASEYELYLLVHADSSSHAKRSETTARRLNYLGMISYYYKLFSETCNLVDDVPATALACDEIEMINLFFKHNSECIECTERIKKIPGLHVTSSANSSIEIVSTLAGKVNAVKCLLDRLGISPDDAIAAGDSHNDVEMLSYVGESLAMSGGNEAARSAAKRVACSNVEGIAKFVLENYFSEENPSL